MIYLSYNCLLKKEPPYWMKVFIKYCTDSNIPYFLSGMFDDFEQYQFTALSDDVKNKLILNNLDSSFSLEATSNIVKGRLGKCKNFGLEEHTLDSLFLNMYAMLRSDIVVYNLDNYSEMHDVIIASVFGIPTIGITESFVNNPIAFQYGSVIVAPKTTKEIANIIIGLTNGKEQK